MASENIINRVDFSKEIGIKDDVVKAVFEGLVNTLAKPDVDGITIAHVGTFTKDFKPAHTSRNPRTGEPVEVADKTVPKFKFSSTFKAAINK